MKFTYFENPYELTNGRYLAKFTGVEEYHNPNAKGKNGEPIPPGYKWNFEIVEGPDTGKIGSLLTGKVPSKKNKLGMLIMSLSDDTLQDGLEFDVDRFIGAYYRITVSEGYMSEAPMPRFQGFNRPSEPETVQSGKTPF